MTKVALIVTGDGLGNVIQATPTIRAFLQAGWEVDVALADAPEDAKWMLKGLELRSVSCSPGPFRGNFYDAVVPNFLHRRAAQTWNFQNVVPVEHPIQTQEMEAEGMFMASRPWHGIQEQPPAYCNYEERFAARPGACYVNLIMGSKTNGEWPKKRYPPESYTRLAVTLLEQHEWLHVNMIGRDGDDKLIPQLIPDAVLNRVHHVWNQPLKLAVSQMKGPGITIGNDTGFTHISSALATRTFMILGPTEPRRSLPPGGIPITLSRRLDCQPCQYEAFHGRAGMGRYADGRKCEKECLTRLDWRQVLQTVAGSIERYRP